MISFWLILALIGVLYFFDDRVKFCVKYVFFVLFVMIASLVMIILALCKLIPKEDVENFDIARILIINLMKIFRLKMNVQKVDNLQIDGPCIIVCNHQSSLDLIGMMHVMPRRCAPLAKQELKWAGPFGFAAAICGTVFIDRLNHQSAMATMQRVSEKMTSQNVPIIPVIFSCFHNFYDKRKFFFQTPGEFTIEALPPIETAGLTIDDVPDLMTRVRKDMMDTYLRISQLEESDLDRPETPKRKDVDAATATTSAAESAGMAPEVGEGKETISDDVAAAETIVDHVEAGLNGDDLPTKIIEQEKPTPTNDGKSPTESAREDAGSENNAGETEGEGVVVEDVVAAKEDEVASIMEEAAPSSEEEKMAETKEASALINEVSNIAGKEESSASNEEMISKHRPEEKVHLHSDNELSRADATAITANASAAKASTVTAFAENDCEIEEWETAGNVVGAVDAGTSKSVDNGQSGGRLAAADDDQEPLFCEKVSIDSRAS